MPGANSGSGAEPVLDAPTTHRFERVLTQLPQGVILVDPTLVIEYANPAAWKLLGAGSVGDPLPEPWPDFSLRDFAEGSFAPDPPAAGTWAEKVDRSSGTEAFPPSPS